MNSKQEYISDSTDGVLNVENLLTAILHQTSDEVDHNEYLDIEQRSEIYSILEAMQTDTEAHRHIIGQWVNEKTGKKFDA